MPPNAQRILVVGPAWVGDMVMAQSLFMTLKQHNPLAVIDVIAPAWTEPLLARMPEVSEAIPMPLGHGQLQLALRWKLGRSLRKRHYDRAIVLPRSWKSAITPFAAGARRRTGFLGEVRVGLLNDIRKLDKQRLPRTVDRFNALGVADNVALPVVAPQPRLAFRPDAAVAKLKELGAALGKAPVLGLCPGAEYGPAKRWPVSHFAQVATHFLDAGWQVWLFGSGKDTEATQAIQQDTGDRCLDLGGRTTLGEAIDLMGLTHTVVSNDSGLMHVAAATGRRLVAIYGSSDPGFTPPLSPRADIVRLGLECSPCFKRECPLDHTRCLTDITPAQIIAQVEQGAESEADAGSDR